MFTDDDGLRLQSGSPAIDAGVDVGLPYSGSAPDIGAYEYGGSLLSSNPLIKFWNWIKELLSKGTVRLF